MRFGRRQFTDTVDFELIDIAAVRTHAMQQVPEIKVAMYHSQIQNLSGWALTAVDDAGCKVCEVGFDLRPVWVSEDIKRFIG